jgi:hypothetical protein
MSNLDAGFNPQIFRKDYPQIIATNIHLATLLGVRLAYNSNGYAAGACLAQNSVSGLFQLYANSGASGTGTAVCFLYAPVDVSDFPSATGTVLERGVFTGELFSNLLSGNDATADGQLGARRFAGSDGITIYKF